MESDKGKVGRGKWEGVRGTHSPIWKAPPETFTNDKYNAPEEMGGHRKCFDSPIKK